MSLYSIHLASDKFSDNNTPLNGIRVKRIKFDNLTADTLETF